MTAPLIGVLEATHDLNTALDECLLLTETQIRGDISNLESEIHKLILHEKQTMNHTPSNELIENSLKLIEHFEKIGDSSALFEKQSIDLLQVWEPKIKEIELKELEVEQLNQLIHHIKLLSKALEVNSKFSNSKFQTLQEKVDSLLQLIEIRNSSKFIKSKFCKWLSLQIEIFMSKVKKELEEEITKIMKTIKWPINNNNNKEKYEPLTRNLVNLFQLQVFSQRKFQKLEIVANEIITTLWCVEQLVKPSYKRFQYHFCTDHKTNSIERPEWFIAFILQCIRDVAPYIEIYLQPSCRNIFSEEYVDLLSQYIKILIQASLNRLEQSWSMVENNDALICHMMDELLIGDRALAVEFGYSTSNSSGSTNWPTLSSFFFKDEKRKASWFRADLKYARLRMDEILKSKTSWKSINQIVMKPTTSTFFEEDKDYYTECSVSVLAMIDALGLRIDLCKEDENFIKSQFVEEIQIVLILEFISLILSYSNNEHSSEKLNSLYPIKETLLDWKFKPRYVFIKRSKRIMKRSLLLFGGAKHHPQQQKRHEEEDFNDHHDGGMEQEDDDWVFASTLNYIQNVLKQQVESISKQVFYEMISSNILREYEKKNWQHGSNDVNVMKEGLSVSEEFRPTLSICNKHLTYWNQKIIPIVRANLISNLTSNLENFFIDFIHTKVFSGSGIVQFKYDLTTLFHLFEIQGVTIMEKAVEERFFPKLHLILTILMFSLEDLKRIRTGDDSFLNIDTTSIDIESIVKLRSGV